MIKIVCDRCGRDIPGPMAGRITWAFAGDYARDVFKNCHFCPCCMEEVKIFIQTPVGQTGNGGMPDIGGEKAAGPATDESEIRLWADETEPEREKSIDIGKIIVLRDAGWTIKAIADDMSLSVHQVSDAISRHHKHSMDGRKDP